MHTHIISLQRINVPSIAALDLQPQQPSRLR
jgi:hypothetical protein